MTGTSFVNLCIFHILDGLSDGLSHFSQPSRAALVYAVSPDDHPRVYDPQNLLAGHERKLKELYLDSDEWRETARAMTSARRTEMVPREPLSLSGLIAFGGASPAIAHQMWFTEHHPDMCSVGPTRRWLEHAARLLAQDLATDNVMCLGTSGHLLQGYTPHAVRDHIVDERNMRMGWDTQLRIYPTLDAVLNISKTVEEGKWPRGRLLFVEPELMGTMEFLARFPRMEEPELANSKHVRKMLTSVEDNPALALVSDGKRIMGVAGDEPPPGSLIADFRGNHGFLLLDGEPVCSFSDGSFQSTTRKAKMVQLEEILLESDLDPSTSNELFKIVAGIVHAAQDRGHGTTVVVDLGGASTPMTGHHLTEPLDLGQPHARYLASSLARVDGALHIGRDLRLHGFACLLDGASVPGESRARGARYNSALRFTQMHQDMVVVVVSSDRPVSILQGGVELTARCAWKPLSSLLAPPPRLDAWLRQAGF
ncbi:diadenylate cyclase [Desulfohalovibrio reitneri]|uniref:diadenylate cyclase n=1 Tax=Desulfohalovibrio reitneri TaxID=1307759 RepID=UPI0004A6E551|nr:diadenylate cyclase [Desulfohalovibrio reitneri]